ncbi:Polysaccharide deacetylase OS=Tsukamurella paurometabola (strain ATCC 8368 / DSM / CCUG 35730/ CIP 100753 / JCM 10117 / KCTC 9821 / NBRC 16120 / NCIMB 702349 / NCTC 13040) OX=521096 GN=Tpau_2991 PE=4 SV=1 [Tsukamurella paurometabola]|uniref:Polysaccharide deacetylase n=1 Tax=Tsukamurella paurometabola (strain ATCC 8368 / DSM 20162 / CCUG 35730 / CIP 100753 / JCM 10117 / KCTC 9821 / NBRC 16120 / NCIMB 702349 / NCTC 13040) TaxID=521096 RepID=D5UU84_TSUPD|nr:polysaccharide deacetylase family protein [Tsukamurella paurometabola]ADG79587.1 polysaccharide deacetylase [Tsukamurella paurometabola DSM 20162]SUP36344.1 Bifunctional xylanase/deacetylase precursor [Tsukamurella paurometabola]
MTGVRGVDRRGLLALLAAGTISVLSGCAASAPAITEDDTPPSPPAPGPGEPLFHPPAPGTPRTPIPSAPITRLPGPGRSLALTVDDGANADVVGAYARFARDTGARLTFFVTGSFPGWTAHRDTLRPLVDAGQVQLVNHTWSHPSLLTLSGTGVARELNRTKDFLRQQFGVDGTPYYRPPFGYRNAAVDAIAADLGFTVPALWFGSLSDSGLITEQYLLDCARKYFREQAIVIGHANHPTVTRVYPQLAEIIRSRNLQLVTLDDVLAPPRR